MRPNPGFASPMTSQPTLERLCSSAQIVLRVFSPSVLPRVDSVRVEHLKLVVKKITTPASKHTHGLNLSPIDCPE